MTKEKLHIFYSHSWVTQLIIEAYVSKYHISYDDILILSNRNFYECIDPNLKERFVNIRKLRFPSWLHAIMSVDKIRRFSKWFKNLTGDNEFILYVPHFYPLEVKMMVQNKNCIAVYLIEEGELSYRPQYYINNLPNHHHTALKKKYFNFFWDNELLTTLKVPTIDSKIISGTLQMFKEAFPYSENKTILINEIQKLVSEKLCFKENVQNILVLTPYVDNLKIEKENYFKDLEKVIDYINLRTEDKIYYKFHPNDTMNVRSRTNIIVEKFQGKFVLLSDEVSLESLIINYKPAVYSFFSSISLYAYLLDCDLNIMCDFISGLRPNTLIGDINLKPFVIQSSKA